MEKKIKTKDRILEKALQLFNEEGVERVTTLYISKEMGISLGNLHYHYPNRNELIKALIDQFVARVQVHTMKLDEAQIVGHIEYAFRIQFLSFRLIWDYRFMFNDRIVIKRRMDYLEVLFAQMIAARHNVFFVWMAELRSKGLLREGISDEVLEAYFQQIIISNNSWVAYNHLFPHEGETDVFFAKQAILNWKAFLNITDDELYTAIDNAQRTVEGMMA